MNLLTECTQFVLHLWASTALISIFVININSFENTAQILNVNQAWLHSDFYLAPIS